MTCRYSEHVNTGRTEENGRAPYGLLAYIDLGLAHKRLIEGFDLPVRVD